MGAQVPPRPVTVLTRWTADALPQSDVDVARQWITAVVDRHWHAVPAIDVVHAGACVEQLPDRCADLVVLDAFPRTTEVEFTRKVARVLRPDGLYLATLRDVDRTLRTVAAVEAAFPHVVVLAEAAVLLRERPGDLVVAASCRELPDLVAWAASARPQVYCLSAAHLTTVCGACS